jgi:hypothetical protein
LLVTTHTQVRTIPPYLEWISRVSFFSYASNVLILNEFEGLTFTGSGPAGLAVLGEALIPGAACNGLSLGGNWGVLLGITVGCRLLCLGLLEAAAHWRFL